MTNETNESFADLFADITSSDTLESTEEINNSVDDVAEEVTEETTEDSSNIEEEDVREVSQEEIQEEVDDVVDESSDEPTEEQVEESPTSQLIQSLIDNGILDYDGETEYEEGENGIRELFNDNLNAKAEEKLNSFKESLGDEGKEFLDFVAKGGTFEDFSALKSEFDYSKVPLEKDGEALITNQQRIIEDYLMTVKGLSQEDATEFVSVYEERGNLFQNAEKAKDGLIKYQEEKQQKLLEERAEAKVREEAEMKAMDAKFKEEVLSKREIAGFKVSKKEAEDLYKFITEPVDKSGKTAFALKDSEENRMLYAYMAMKGFNKDALSKEEKRKQVVKLKKALSNYSDKNAETKKSSNELTRKKEENVTGKIDWLI